MKLKLPVHLLLISLLLPGGCSVSRQAEADRSFQKADAVAWAMRDSLALSRSLQASVGRSVRMRHVTFSRPDTAGRQYVESATLLSAATSEVYTGQASGERKQMANLTETHAGQSAEHTATASRIKRFPYWITAVAAAGIAGAFFIGKRSD
jgi:hypothetical protein